MENARRTYSRPGYGALVLWCIAVLTTCQRVHLTEEFIHDSLITQLVASEPDLVAPVAMTQDVNGDLWVVEMPGYMRDIAGSGEDIADGRIVVLKDHNADGVADERIVFLDSLLNPRALLHIDHGLLYSDGPALKWIEVANGRPGRIEMVDSLYVVGGNIEHQPNGLLFNIDNWIYSARGTVRYQKINNTWVREATAFRGQWGITQDLFGRLLYNHNALSFATDRVLPNALMQNPYLELDETHWVTGSVDQRVYPTKASLVNRGYEHGVLDSSGRLREYTSACAPHMYLGGVIEEWQGNVFVCAPEANLIARYVIADELDNLGGQRERKGTEFIESLDAIFRPVNLYTGLDGALYVVDMRKGIIQHRAYMSEYLRSRSVDRGLNAITGLGRVYRLSDTTRRFEIPNFKEDLIALLEHRNLAVRLEAQKRLLYRDEEADRSKLTDLVSSSTSDEARSHALWILHHRGWLDAEMLVEILTSRPTTLLRWHALALSTHHDISRFEELLDNLVFLDRQTDLLIANLAGRKNYLELWLKLANYYSHDRLISVALVSGIANLEAAHRQWVNDTTMLAAVIDETLDNRANDRPQLPSIPVASFDDDRTSGLKLFKTYCASCHGMEGKGQPSVAPPLTTSEVIAAGGIHLARAILDGSFRDSSEYLIPMPRYIDSPEMTDRRILDLVRYLHSVFGVSAVPVDTTQIDSLRQILLANREEM